MTSDQPPAGTTLRFKIQLPGCPKTPPPEVLKLARAMMAGTKTARGKEKVAFLYLWGDWSGISFWW